MAGSLIGDCARFHSPCPDEPAAPVVDAGVGAINTGETSGRRSAAAFDNPDHTAVVIHNYRWRLGLAAGEPNLDVIEQRLAAFPAISVPTITLEGDTNGAPHPAPADYAGRFTGKYLHRTLTGGIGHNLPQQAPRDFAHAIEEADSLV